DPIKMILPVFWLIITGDTAAAQLNEPSVFTLNVLCHSSFDSCQNGPRVKFFQIPALHTRTSMRPNLPITALTIASTEGRDETSATSAMQFADGCRARMELMAPSRSLASTSMRTTLAPASQN